MRQLPPYRSFSDQKKRIADDIAKAKARLHRVPTKREQLDSLLINFIVLIGSMIAYNLTSIAWLFWTILLVLLSIFINLIYLYLHRNHW